jgi:ABC-type lipoprotein export system ATPase subunit
LFPVYTANIAHQVRQRTDASNATTNNTPTKGRSHIRRTQVPEINRNYRLLTTAALTGAMLLVAACASTPRASLNEAKLAIEAAESADASHYATAELDEARQKLIAADAAVLKKEMLLADRYAQQSTVTAELATARTEAAKVQAVNAELERGVKALIEEIERTGDQQ